MSTTKQKRLLYKVAVFSQQQTKTLETLVYEALKQKNKVSSRLQENPEGNERRFINYHLKHTAEAGNLYGCEFLAYEAGSDQSIVKVSQDAQELDVSAIPAGEDQEFIAGSVYFALLGNHVVLFQSAALRTIDLENHLNWLLTKSTTLLSEDERLTLNDCISSSKKHNLQNVKGISLSNSLFDDFTVDLTKTTDPKNQEQLQQERMKLKPQGIAWDMLQPLLSVFIPEKKDFDPEEILKMQELEVELFLSWKGRHKAEEQNAFLNHIATKFRHIDNEIDYKIHTSNGIVGKKDIKTQKEYSIRWTDTGRPDFEDLFPKMSNWLASLLDDGSIDPS